MQAFLAVHCWILKADPGLIEQVVMNLAVNSRDAMPNGGRLVIEIADVEIEEPAPTMPPGIKPGRYVTLAVHDTGVGMDSSVQEHCSNRSSRLKRWVREAMLMIRFSGPATSETTPC
ncbi:MAG TPA: hypothetical protein VNH83_10215 [Bryobacteraceae bacterium]|jgi:signal transduction histidine kinase|nr:hypothetical protein [Bryobacteraceae bacterium]